MSKGKLLALLGGVVGITTAWLSFLAWGFTKLADAVL